MVNKIYIGDIGTRLRTTLNIDLAGYSSISYKIRKPSGSILTKPCTPEDVANGIIYYDSIDGDFDEVGSYRIQADITFTNGSHNESVTRSFTVYEKFK